jgi:hypothetical protein
MLYVLNSFVEILLILKTVRSKTLPIFARSNVEILGSNPNQGIDVFVRSFCVCVALCVGSRIATSRPQSNESYRLRIGLRN